MSRTQDEAAIASGRDKIATMGRQMDFEQDSMLSIDLPEGKFSGQMLKTLIDSLNQFTSMLEMDQIAISPTDTTTIPLDLVKILMAITLAAEDAGMGIDVDLNEVVADRDLAKIAGQLNTLAKNEEFRAFLSESIGDDMIMDDEEVEEEVVMEDEIPVEMDEMEDTFARRL